MAQPTQKQDPKAASGLGKTDKVEGQDPKEIAKLAVRMAQKKGAQQVAAAATKQREVEVAWRDGKLEKISEATTRQLAVQLYVDGRYAMVNTSDLRPDALSTFLDNAISMTRTLAKDPFRTLPDPALYQGQAEINLLLVDDKYDDVAPNDRRRIAKELEDAARGEKAGAPILSVTTNFSDTLHEVFRVTSNGFEGSRKDTQYVISAEVSVKDKDGRRPEDYAFAAGRFFGGLPAPAKVGKEAAQRALSRLGAKKAASAVVPMVVDARAGGRLVSFLQQPLSGQALQQRRSFFEGKVGKQIGSAKLTVTDDPLIVSGLGSRHFDNEGIAAKRIPIFEAGVLRNYYVDNYYGRKLKMTPTTARPSNLSWQLGDKTQAQLLSQIKDGFFVTGFIGGNSNGTTGDFSLGVLGFRIRDGKVAEAVSEMNISGNHLELWNHLVAVGNDPYLYSPLRTPTLVFDKVQFAGT